MKPNFPIYYALDRNILVVADRLHGDYWGAYVGIVDGRDHSAELRQVLKTGTKLRREGIARAIFPELSKLPYGF